MGLFVNGEDLLKPEQSPILDGSKKKKSYIRLVLQVFIAPLKFQTQNLIEQFYKSQAL